MWNVTFTLGPIAVGFAFNRWGAAISFRRTRRLEAVRGEAQQAVRDRQSAGTAREDREASAG